MELRTIIAAVNANPSVHPLTCGNDSRHSLLVPVVDRHRVILICPDCAYRQDTIPPIVLTAYPEVIISNTPLAR